MYESQSPHSRAPFPLSTSSFIVRSSCERVCCPAFPPRPLGRPAPILKICQRKILLVPPPNPRGPSAHWPLTATMMTSAIGCVTPKRIFPARVRLYNWALFLDVRNVPAEISSSPPSLHMSQPIDCRTRRESRPPKSLLGGNL